MADSQKWRNRIVDQRMVPVAELRANPANWRRHPKHQAEALGQVMGRVGVVQGVMLNIRSVEQGWPDGEMPTMVDGHLRLELAQANGEDALPTTVVDLSPEEERLTLATLDPLGALAEADTLALAALRDELPDLDGELGAMLERLTIDAGISPPDFHPGTEDDQSRLDQKQSITCPKCGHEFTR